MAKRLSKMHARVAGKQRTMGIMHNNTQVITTPRSMSKISVDIGNITFISKDNVSNYSKDIAVISVVGEYSDLSNFNTYMSVSIPTGGYGGNTTLVTAEMAEKIYAFVTEHKANKGFVVTCTYGEQRSAATALAVSDAFNLRLDLSSPHCMGRTGFSNRDVERQLYRLLREIGNSKTTARE